MSSPYAAPTESRLSSTETSATDDRAERDREQDEAEPEHEEEHVRRRVRHGVEVVDVLGGRAADVDRRARSREDRRDQVRAEVAHRADGRPARGVAAQRRDEQRDVLAGRSLGSAVAESRVGRESLVELPDSASTAAGAAAATISHGRGLCAGEVALERELPCLTAGSRQRLDAVRADVQAEDRRGAAPSITAGRQRRATAPAGAARLRRSASRSDLPTCRRVRGSGRGTGTRKALTRSPSMPSSAGSSVSAAATETMPTRIAPEREAPHDRCRHDQHAEQRDHEGAPAEEHGAARGRARERDRVLLASPRARSSR